MAMPYIESKKLRIAGIALLAGGLLLLVGYLSWIKNSGEIVATSLPVSASVTVGALIDRPMADILARQESIVFSPITLTPDMGEIRLDIHLTQTGIISKESGTGTQTFSVTNAATGEEIFQRTGRGMIRIPADTAESTSGFSIKNSSTHVGTFKVKDAGSYVVHAMLEKWLLASPYISMELVARTGALAADIKIIVALAFTVFLGIMLCWMTTPPHLRKTKTQKTTPRQY